MNTFVRSFPLEDIQIQRGGDGRTVEAYAAVFDSPAEVRDHQGHYVERIARSAFDKTIRERGNRVAVLYNHGMTVHGTPSDAASVPIGKALEVRADSKGLFTVTRYNTTPLAESVLENIRDGAITAQSFRGRIFKSTPDRPAKRGVGGALPEVTRTELGLMEYGPTPFPTYEDASIVAVRTATEIADSIAGLDPHEREELIRLLSTTPGEPVESTTPVVEPVPDEPRTHSGRSLSSRVHRELILRGIRL